jgi:hypothetical protein
VIVLSLSSISVISFWKRKVKKFSPNQNPMEDQQISIRPIRGLSFNSTVSVPKGRVNSHIPMSVVEAPAPTGIRNNNNIFVSDETRSEIIETLQRLVPYSQVEIDKLPTPAKTDLETIVGYVRLLFDTDYYSELYRLMSDIFPVVDPNSVRPGTVLAYMVGCASVQERKDPGCTVQCAGSAPLPKNIDAKTFCDYSVLHCSISQDRFQFKRLNSIITPDVLIFLPERVKFSKFSDDETYLLSTIYQVKRVKVFEINSDNEATQVVGGDEFVTLSSVTAPKNSPEVKRRFRTNDINGSGWTFAAIIGIIVLLLLLMSRTRY